MDITELLTITATRDASDLHLVATYVPTLRIHGELHALVTMPKLTTENIEQMIFTLLNPTQKELLLTNRELDFSAVLQLNATTQVRFRANAYYQKGFMSAAFRLIPSRIKSLEELHLPPILHEFTKLRQGFILATGPSGQGKSTTLAALIDEINQTRNVHTITVEDPIEYVYPSGKSMISQREMYQDTHSWSGALKNILREDPDVVFIGEMRDYETVSSALTIAETGHLVFSTLHTNSASQTIDRIIDIFPPITKDQVRLQLSMVLSGVVTQRLVPAIGGGRVPICEILIGTPSVRNIIREGKSHLIDNVIQTSASEGMMIFEDHLKQMVDQNIVSHDVALEYALRPERYIQLMEH